MTLSTRLACSGISLAHMRQTRIEFNVYIALALLSSEVKPKGWLRCLLHASDRLVRAVWIRARPARRTRTPPVPPVARCFSSRRAGIRAHPAHASWTVPSTAAPPQPFFAFACVVELAAGAEARRLESVVQIRLSQQSRADRRDRPSTSSFTRSVEHGEKVVRKEWDMSLRCD